MKYEINFTGTKAQKEKQALHAIKEYLGVARYLAFRRQLVDYHLKTEPGQSHSAQYRNVRLGCWAVGISGYLPQRALAREVLRIVDNVRSEIVIA